MSKVKKGLKKINNCLDLPEGLLTGGVHIELQSDERALIDGKCTVLKYSDTEIKMNTGTGIIIFVGQNLSLDTLQINNSSISGKIKKIEFEN